MTTVMLFYEHAVPVSRRRHGGCSVEVRDYGFCRRVNSVPLLALEFTRAAGEYPVVFAGNAGSVRPVVVLGLRAGENLLVSDAGAWLGRYIPAFVRRYPFVFSTGAEDQRFVLCVDEAFAGFNHEGRGESLFAEGGEPSPYVGRVLRFLQEYRAQFVRTQAFCRRLEELALLEPMQARVTVGEAKLALGGFSTVSKRKLQALPGETLATLAASDELELLYLHLLSLRHFESLRQRLALQSPPQPELPAMPSQPAGDVPRATLH